MKPKPKAKAQPKALPKVRPGVLLAFALTFVVVGTYLVLKTYAAPLVYTGATSTVTVTYYDYYSCQPVPNLSVQVYLADTHNPYHLKAIKGVTDATGTVVLSNVPYGYSTVDYAKTSAYRATGWGILVDEPTESRQYFAFPGGTGTVGLAPAWINDPAVCPIRDQIDSGEYAPR